MNDIFISYGHIDDEPLTEGQKGWISVFHRNLEIRLSQLLGHRPSIWRDPKLLGNDVLDDAIIQELPQTKALVSVISPRYLQSEWCVREVTEFYQSAQRAGSLQVGNKCRIFKVVKTPVPLNEMPSLLNQIFGAQLGFEFYQVDPELGRLREFDEEFGPDAKRLFLERIYDLAHDLCELLKAIDRRAAAPATPAAPAPASASGPGKVVYLAATTSDLQDERDRIRRELVERGHVVVPDASLPTVAAELEAEVRRYLAGSQFAVHLVGNRYGLVPEDSDCSMVELQNRWAAERCATGPFSRIIWMPKNLQPRDARQQAFVRAILEDAAAQRGAELMQDTVEKLKGLIHDRLAPPEKKNEPAPAPAPGAPPLVYLICDRPDEPAVDPVEDFLFEQGFEVGRSQWEGTEAEVGAANRQYLQVCDAALVYYGAGSRAWAEMKLLDLMQAPGYGRTKPMRAKAVCVAPPDDRNKQRFRTQLAEVIRLGESFAPEALAPFVRLAKGAP